MGGLFDPYALDEKSGDHLPPEGVSDVPQARLQIGGLTGHGWNQAFETTPEDNAGGGSPYLEG